MSLPGLLTMVALMNHVDTTVRFGNIAELLQQASTLRAAWSFVQQMGRLPGSRTADLVYTAYRQARERLVCVSLLTSVLFSVDSGVRAAPFR